MRWITCEHALDDLEAAVAAGEISAGEAAAISRLVREALGHDRDALGTIDDEDPVRDTLADLDDALEDKEEVGDWIYYGDDLDFADLGCKINVFGVAGDVGAATTPARWRSWPSSSRWAGRSRGSATASWGRATSPSVSSRALSHCGY